MSTSDFVSLIDRQRRLRGQPSDRIDSPGTHHRIMACKWDLLEDLLEGTEAMRWRRERWLPQHEKESQKSYDNRIKRSFLFAAYKEVIHALSSKPFAQPIVLKSAENLPERLIPLEENADRTGRNVTEWGKEVFRTALTYGLTHVLVDFPRNERILSGAGRPDLRDETAQGLRARFVHVTPRQLIGWDTRKDQATGALVLERIRILEEVVEPEGLWGDQVVRYVTVYTRRDVHRFRRTQQDSDFVPMTPEPVPHTFPGIPLITFYTQRTGLLTAEPPFQDLADLNLQHWQIASDFANIMHVSRFAILFGRGIPEEKWRTIAIGPMTFLKTDSTEADLRFVEHGGNATGAGMNDLEKIEERMERLGLNPLMRRQGNMTATSAAINNARAASQMQAWVEGFERFLKLAYQHAAMWTREVLPEDFAVEAFKDFDIVLRGAEDLRELREARKLRLITARTYLQEVQKRGLISEGVDVETELDLLEDEASEFGSFEPGPGDDDRGEDAVDPSAEAATSAATAGG